VINTNLSSVFDITSGSSTGWRGAAGPRHQRLSIVGRIGNFGQAN
jgi:hypothetical protein